MYPCVVRSDTIFTGDTWRCSVHRMCAAAELRVFALFTSDKRCVLYDEVLSRAMSFVFRLWVKCGSEMAAIERKTRNPLRQRRIELHIRVRRDFPQGCKERTGPRGPRAACAQREQGLLVPR